MLKILVVDDDEKIVILLKDILETSIQDCKVITALDGVEGIEKAKIELPDTILLNIKMPGIDGFEVCKRLKKNERLKDIPIIIITGVYKDIESKIKALELGADIFIAKPIERNELIAQVKVALRIKQAEDKLRNEKELLEVLVLERTKELTEIKDKYKKLINNATEAIFVAQEGYLKFFNPKTIKISGYNKEELSSKPFINFIHPDDRDMVVERHKIRLNGNEFLHKYPFRIIDKKGNLKWVEINATLIEWENKPATLNFLNDITERKLAEKHIKDSLKEKEVMLREINHRVRNNMQIMQSLINLQSKHIEDKKALIAFKETSNRIMVMSKIQGKLYQSENLNGIAFDSYIRNITTHILSSFSKYPSLIQLNINAKNILLDVKKAIPCGLIINELVTNCVMHAFPNIKERPEDEKCNINIDVSIIKGDKYKFIISDNGIGFPDDIDFKKTESLGLQLVNTLVEQLEGNIELSHMNGTTFKIVF